MAASRPTGRGREPAQGRPPCPAGAGVPARRGAPRCPVTLFPGHRVETDADAFEHAAREALHQDDPAACAAVAAAYPGDVLPDVRYEEWTQTAREHLRALHRDLLRRGELWEELAEAEPTDEPAYRELMRAALDAGNRHAAIRWYGRLRTVLGQELGVPPGRETDELYGKCVAGLRRTEERIVGRQVELAHLEAALDAADRGELGLLAVRGPAGIGKSALSRRAASLARERGWTVLTVSPAGETGPYEPLVELIEQLIRRDRKVLAGLPERTRSVLAELTPLASPAAPLDGALTRHMVIGAVRRLLPDGRVARDLSGMPHHAGRARRDRGRARRRSRPRRAARGIRPAAHRHPHAAAGLVRRPRRGPRASRPGGR